MRVLFDLGHPAHFHLFHHAMTALRDGGHDVEIVAYNKDCLLGLLDAHGWPYHLVARRGTSMPALGWLAGRAMGRMVRVAARKRIDLMAGTSVAIGPASRLTGAKSLVFGEDDAAVVPLFARLAYTTAHYVVTPASLAHENHGDKHLTYPGYQELAYLHPRRFTPDPAIRRDLGLTEGQKYFLVRLVALKAHHDVGEKGLSTEQAHQVIARLGRFGKVFVSAEANVPPSLNAQPLPVGPERIFDVLAGADLVVGDSQTVTAEAAVLGTPAVRCNSFVGRLSYLTELEQRFGLAVGVRPDRFGDLLTRLDDWLSRADLKQQWQRRRQAMLDESVDLTAWMLDLFTRVAAGEKVRRDAAAARAA